MKEFQGKKILIIVENLPVPLDRRVWQEAKALKNKGAMVSIICPAGKGFYKKYEVLQNIAIYRHSLPLEARTPSGYLIEYPAALFWEFILSIKCLFQRGFNVIHACDPPDLIFLIGAFYKIFGKKFVFDHHDLNPELYIAKFGKKGLIYRILLLLERLSFKTADISIATNNSFKEIAAGRGGMRSDNIFIVRSGPEIEKFKPVEPEAKYKKGKKYLIGYLGVIGKQDGLHYMLEACDYLVNKKGRKDIHFICIGGGTELDNVMKYAEELKLKDCIDFTGMVYDNRVLLKILSTVDVCIATDIYNEMNNMSTMNKIMEYMALKKPIVQFDLKEGRFTADKASLYARPDDPIDMARRILKLLEDPVKRKEMGDFGYNRIKNKLAWKYEKENLHRAYKKLFSDF